jgi:hypothetical protein
MRFAPAIGALPPILTRPLSTGQIRSLSNAMIHSRLWRPLLSSHGGSEGGAAQMQSSRRRFRSAPEGATSSSVLAWPVSRVCTSALAGPIGSKAEGSARRPPSQSGSRRHGSARARIWAIATAPEGLLDGRFRVSTDRSVRRREGRATVGGSSITDCRFAGRSGHLSAGDAEAGTRPFRERREQPDPCPLGQESESPSRLLAGPSTADTGADLWPGLRNEAPRRSR